MSLLEKVGSFGCVFEESLFVCFNVSGGHINPAVTFGLFLARKLSLTRAVFYMIMQCLGAICGAGVVKGFQPTPYETLGGGANTVAPGYSKGSGLGAEIIGTFVLVYTVFSATDAKRSARDSHVPVRDLTFPVYPGLMMLRSVWFVLARLIIANFILFIKMEKKW